MAEKQVVGGLPKFIRACMLPAIALAGLSAGCSADDIEKGRLAGIGSGTPPLGGIVCDGHQAAPRPQFGRCARLSSQNSSTAGSQFENMGRAGGLAWLCRQCGDLSGVVGRAWPCGVGVGQRI